MRQTNPTTLPCQTVDPDLFFDVTDAGREKAIAVCGPCPLADRCLEVALAHEGGRVSQARYGVWGGTTPMERYRMQRRTRRGAA